MFDPSRPPAADLAMLHSFRHPACLHDGAYDVVAANSAFRQMFPGTGPGANLLTAILLEPMARIRLGDWHTEAQHMVTTFRESSAEVRPERREEILTMCRRLPEWDQLWENTVTPDSVVERTLRMLEPETRREQHMYIQNFRFQYPVRPWWLLAIVPID
ncbi:hypothetical protein AB0N05_00965 [Nocardia sp. NPDC051030]|uniref:MmyB family transcriptional regulator n=1 Tax=Nocardia sp. NPDC051030 TaxID=3155162 RepID=UPI00341EE350